MTKFGIVTQVTEKHVSRESDTPSFQGGEAQTSPILGSDLPTKRIKMTVIRTLDSAH